MAETDAAVPTGAQSSPEQNSVARQPTTAPVAPAAVVTPAATQNPALSDSIVITNFVSERVFGLTGTMQLIFDMTSLDQPTLGNDVITPASQTPLVTDAITPRVLPSSPDHFDAVTRADIDTPLVNGKETVGGTPSEGFSRKSIFPIILAVGILLTLAALIVIIITCVRAHRRRSVQRKVYSKHIVNSTVASMERERRRQRNNNGRLNRFSRQNRRRNGEFLQRYGVTRDVAHRLSHEKYYEEEYNIAKCCLQWRIATPVLEVHCTDTYSRYHVV